MARGAVPAALAALALLAGCRGEAFKGPLRLLERSDADGRRPRLGTLTAGGETRAALLASARFDVPLPPRALLTFGAGVTWSDAGEAPGWFHLLVRAAGRTLADETLNPRALREFREVSVPLEGLGRRTTLQFELRLAERDGRTIEAPPGLLLGVAEPTIHDLDDYGRSPLIVLVSIDTLRRDHVGSYGYAKPTTPRLDALAASGLLCEDAVSTSSWTLPAHLSMLTSTSPGVHGGVDLHHGFTGKLPTLAERLHAAGFATRAVTSHLYVSAVYGLERGFDRLDFRQDRKADEVAARALDLLDRFADRPLFLFLHFYDPHWHYDPPPDRLKLFEAQYTGTLTGLWQDFSRRDPKRLSQADLDHLKALYDGEIRFVDDELGLLLDRLRERAMSGNALLLVTSDHGEEFLEHGSWEHQKTLYEEVIRVPLLVAGPRVPRRRESAQVSVLDVAPTILAWAGVAAPESFEGKSLLSALGEREAYGETDHTLDHGKKLFLRAGQGRWKAIFTLARDASGPPREEWYDLATDPAELRQSRPAESTANAIRARALARWRADRTRGGGGAPVELTPEQVERLRTLGYVGS